MPRRQPGATGKDICHDFAMDLRGWVVSRRSLSASVVAMVAIAVPAMSGSARAASTSFNYCAHSTAVFAYPRPYIGVTDTNVEDAVAGSYRDCSLGWMAASGIGYLRGTLDWGLVEDPSGQYHWGIYDALFTELAQHHVRFLAGLLGEPTWESTAPAHGAKPGGYPPKSPADFAQFAALAVQRYGPGGTFWRENPNLPYDPVQAWEVWNEPNLAEYWEPRPNMRAYVALLRAADVAIKGVDPHAVVVSGGMPFYGSSDETKFISALFRFGARGYFDALGIHPYSATVAQAEQRLGTARRLLDRFGDLRTAVWVTEVGWAGGDPDGFISNARGQRANAVKFFRFVNRNRRALRLGEVFWSAWQDRISGPGPRNWWGFHLGVISTAGRPKPALGALAAAAQVLDR